MSDQNDSTLSMRRNGKWFLERLLKMLIPVALFGIAVFLAVSQDWIGVTKQGAVDAKQVAAHGEQIKEIKTEFVRKDVLEPRLSALERRVDELREEQKRDSAKIDQILFEVRRK